MSGFRLNAMLTLAAYVSHAEFFWRGFCTLLSAVEYNPLFLARLHAVYGAVLFLLAVRLTSSVVVICRLSASVTLHGAT